LGSGVEDLEFMVDSERVFRVQGLGFRVEDLEFMVDSERVLGFRV